MNGLTKKPILLGISGASGSGKSTVSKLLANTLPSSTRVCMDNYFMDKHEFPKLEGWEVWDHPDAINWKMLKSDIVALANGEEVYTNKLNKRTFKRSIITLRPSDVVIVEGFLLFWHKQLRDMFNIKVFLDLPENKIVERRKKRFGNHGDHKPDYDKHVVIPAYREYGLPAKSHADIIIDARRPIEEIAEDIARKLE